MVCSKCKETGILNSALGKEFWYCRSCKSEIQLELVENKSGELTDEQIEDLFNANLWPMPDPNDDMLQDFLDAMDDVSDGNGD